MANEWATQNVQRNGKKGEIMTTYSDHYAMITILFFLCRNLVDD